MSKHYLESIKREDILDNEIRNLSIEELEQCLRYYGCLGLAIPKYEGKSAYESLCEVVKRLVMDR